MAARHLVPRHLFRLQAGARHDLDGRRRELAARRLAAQHHAVGAVEDGVRHVRALGARRPRVVDHRLEHLRRHHARLAGGAATSGDHHLLLAEDALGRDLHPEVAARHHHAVGHLEDLVELVEALLVLDLRDDLDVLAARVGVEDRADVQHVGRRLDERGGDEVDLVRHAKLLEVVDVLLLQHGQVDLHIRQVHVLPLADRLVVLDLALDGGGEALGHRQHERAVGDQDRRPRLHRGGQLLVGARNLGLVALVRVVRRDLEGLPRLQVDLAAALLLEEAGADLRALRVEQDRDVLVGPLRVRLAHTLQRLPVGLVVTVRKLRRAVLCPHQ